MNTLIDQHVVKLMLASLDRYLASLDVFSGFFPSSPDLVDPAWIATAYNALVGLKTPKNPVGVAVFHSGDRGTKSLPFVSVEVSDDGFEEEFLGAACGDLREDGKEWFEFETTQKINIVVCAEDNDVVRALNALVFGTLVFERETFIEAGYQDFRYMGSGSLSAYELFISEKAGAYTRTQRWEAPVVVDMRKTPVEYDASVKKPWFLHHKTHTTLPTPEPNQTPPVDPTEPNPTPNRAHSDEEQADAGGVVILTEEENS